MIQGRIDWKTLLGEGAPELLHQVTALQKIVYSEGELSLKTKMLMLVLCNAVTGHAQGVMVAADHARSAGASEEEIRETAQVVFWMAGFPGVVNCAMAFPSPPKE